MKNSWISFWETEEYQDLKKKNFSIIDSYFKKSPKTILDIGCGYAFESEMFQKKYNSHLYLLDGEKDHTQRRETNFGSTDTMSLYNPVSTLIESFDQRKMTYTFVDNKNIQLNDNIKFDLIYSFLSCGFHYPAVTYRDLVKTHSHENTVVLFDIRENTFKDQQKDFEVLSVVHRGPKHFTCQIKFR